MLLSSPQVFGFRESRWTLRRLQAYLAPDRQASLAALSSLLKRCGLSYKRGRAYVHSPDPLYLRKLSVIEWVAQQVRRRQKPWVLLYSDELTYYRRASLSQSYGKRGSDGPRVEQGYSSNKKRRLAGCLDSQTGRFLCWQRSKFDHRTWLAFLLHVEQAYPDAQRIFIVVDNWPVHRHPAVLAALAHSKITLLYQPTYAPWTNPVEKVWRKLKEDLLHHHPFCDDWEGLQRAVQEWLTRADAPSPDLLHYVGLLRS
jgi:hypothetical protein